MKIAIWALSLIGTAAVAKWSEEILEWLTSRLRSRGQRRAGFSRHFRGIPHSSDLLIYTTTARPNVPLTDFLYMELLRYLLREGTLQHAMITTCWPESALERASFAAVEPRYRRYLAAFADEFADRVTLLEKHGPDFPKLRDGTVPECIKNQPPSDAGLPETFWKAIRHVTGPSYKTRVKRLGLPDRRIRNMNRARPIQFVLYGIVAHTANNAILAPFVLETLRSVGGGEDAQLTLSVLFWELELDRLGVFYYLRDEQAALTDDGVSFDLNAIAGRTVRASRKEASDNQTTKVSLSLAEDPLEQLDVVGAKRRRELREYIRILQTVLILNYDFTESPSSWRSQGKQVFEDFAAQNSRPVPRRMSRSAYELVYLMRVARTKARLR